MKRKELNRHREKEKETEQNLEDDFLDIEVSRKLFSAPPRLITAVCLYAINGIGHHLHGRRLSTTINLFI